MRCAYCALQLCLQPTSGCFTACFQLPNPIIHAGNLCVCGARFLQQRGMRTVQTHDHGGQHRHVVTQACKFGQNSLVLTN
jgi:hypothetical protein